MKYKFLPVFFASLLPLIPLKGQEAEEVVSMDFTVALLDLKELGSQAVGVKPAELKYTRGPEVHDIVIRPGSTSDLRRYVGPLPIIFFREETNAEGEVVRVPLCQVAGIPRSAKRVLIALIEAGDGRYRGKAVDFSEDVLPVDHVKFVNFSDFTLAAEVSGERAAIAPGSELVMERREVRPYKFYLRLAGERNGQWEPIRSSAYASVPGTRQLFFIYHLEGKRNPWRIYEVSGLDSANDLEREAMMGDAEDVGEMPAAPAGPGGFGPGPGEAPVGVGGEPSL